ncbi:hypothetical protein PL11201_690045 [Planktothrix sp. PCC 11201]|uniref:hypothetical protein n=1 Tax=Planktothrix sp. PCC 11201 TaxID=1729650 RepID=UPI00090FF7E9|nr:hypothetical protein [Planktothrix sp. PCC 11201]SKB15024.1 hypothetical protein PL11201_690045 [Planktothrix sp. PCC 11201]
MVTLYYDYHGFSTTNLNLLRLSGDYLGLNIKKIENFDQFLIYVIRQVNSKLYSISHLD